MSESRFISKEGQQVPSVSIPVRDGETWATKTTEELFSNKTVVVFLFLARLRQPVLLRIYLATTRLRKYLNSMALTTFYVFRSTILLL